MPNMHALNSYDNACVLVMLCSLTLQTVPGAAALLFSDVMNHQDGETSPSLIS
jgi:hypothetical protein